LCARRPLDAGVAARRAEVVAAEVQPVVAEQLLGAIVGQCRPLELEEQQLGLDLGGSLLHQLQQRAAGRIGRVGGEAQGGERAGLPDQLVDLRQLVHRGRQCGGVQLGHPTGVRLGEGLG